jgi:2-methylisocitrate lyase-like PEP mutase family enzyme
MENFEQPIPKSIVADEAGVTDLRAAFDARRQAFRTLHEEGCFLMPNPWDVGSARYLQRLGFPALATTSAGFAFSQGLPDSDAAVGLVRSLSHIAEAACDHGRG